MFNLFDLEWCVADSRFYQVQRYQQILSNTNIETLNPEILDAKDTGIRGPRSLYSFNLEIFDGRCINFVMTARRLGVIEK